MNETPRLRSAFPNSPRTDARYRGTGGSARSSYASAQSSSSFDRPSPLAKPIRILAQSEKKKDERLIPFDVVDAPTQRFYVVGFYVLLWVWKLYNAYHISGDLDSTWYFLQWSGTDIAFLIVLSWLQIPWLEFSYLTSGTLWILHTIVNAFLMYHIPLPIFFWLTGLSKLFWDRELSIGGQGVKPADILHNSSIILGKQIIHILPEGSAILNPQKQSYCIDAQTPSVELPIQINQTAPILIELTRYDLDGEDEEKIEIKGKQAKALKKQADKGYAKSETNTPRLLQHRVSKTGLYRLERVIDESNLEVRRRSYDVAVVDCPKAFVTTSSEHACTSDVSKTSIGVNGVPPFKVKYSKRINQQQFSSIVQSIQAPNTDDHLFADGTSNVVLDPSRPQLGWTQSTSVSFDINEALNKNGTWTYVVEDVEDGLGNKIVYDLTNEKEMVRGHRSSSLVVHNRPTVDLVGCNGERPLRVAKEDTTSLPIRVRPVGQIPATDWPLKLKYSFMPDVEGEAPVVEDALFDLTGPGEANLPRINKAGRYSIDSVETQFCRGEVVEPSSCTLFNPPRPMMSIDSEDIFDKCAGNPIGMTVNLDFTGSPPFKVRYSVEHNGKASPKMQEFNSMRGQLEFREKSAGSYVYRFLGIGDDVYNDISLKDKDMTLRQNIRPPATANFADGKKLLESCFGESVQLPVKFSGEGPWDLDYEIDHNGKRKKHHKHSEEDLNLVELPEQPEGGDYTIILTGVQDRLKCKTSLQDERTVRVRPEQPQAAFGDIDGKRIIRALDGKSVKLPLRLKGFAPWSVQIKNLDTDSRPTEQTFNQPNGIFSVDRPGTYEIVSVRDQCPGFVNPKANTFTVAGIPRPSLMIRDDDASQERHGNYRKPAVCQGEDSTLGLALTGNPPYRLKYSQKHDPVKGAAAISNKPLSIASNSASINLETSKAGEYTYVFNELNDDRYTHDKRHFHDITIRQQVHSPPTAKFSSPGRTYGYCKDDPTFSSSPESETVPLVFTGKPPFSVDISIAHHGVAARPEIVKLRDISSMTYNWEVSRSSLEVGTHALSIRSIKDANGCQSYYESDPSGVKIAVSSPPTIIPLESTADYCVGEHVSFSLSGQAPFEVFYNFQNRERKAKVTGSEFRRIAESPGEFTVTGISDSAMGSGKCRARKDITKFIHPYPSVKISHGRTLVSDIHEGGEVEIHFEFTGTPPFEFTYTRSENAKKGQKARVLETRHDSSSEFSKTVRASDEGTYEVVAIKDRYCAYARDNQGYGGKGQKMLQY